MGIRGIFSLSLVLLCAGVYADAAVVAQFRDKKTAEETWQETALRPSELDRSGMVTNRTCRASEKGAQACISALSAFAATSTPSRIVLPKSLLNEERYQDGVVEKDYGTLVLLRAPEKVKPSKPLSRRESAAKMKADRDQLNAAMLQATGSSYDFDSLRERVLAETTIPQRDGYQTATAMSVYVSIFDGHARFETAAKQREALQSGGSDSFVGIGATIQTDVVTGTHMVAGILPDSPASKSPLRIGDVFEKVGAESMAGKPVEEVVNLIRGPVGTSVNLTINRGGQSVSMTIVRAKVESKNVSSTLIKDERGAYAYIRLATFMNDHGCDDIEAEYENLQKQGAKAVILDVRGNGGGLLDQALCIGGLFVGPKVITKVRDLNSNSFKDLEGSRSQSVTVPTAILIDAGSASASELLAGALQDHERAWVVGERSFGKGSVQQTGPYRVRDPKLALLPPGGVLVARTIALFYQPNGRTNQLEGIIPNFEVPRKPNATDDERYSPREIDLVPNAIPAASVPWKESRPAVVSKLQQCMSKTGRASTQYQPVGGTGADKRDDYQVLSAVDLLACELSLTK